MKYEANVPEHFGNSFWTNVKTRWNYNDNSTWIKLIGVTDKQWNGTFTEIDGTKQLTFQRLPLEATRNFELQSLQKMLT